MYNMGFYNLVEVEGGKVNIGGRREEFEYIVVYNMSFYNLVEDEGS